MVTAKKKLKRKGRKKSHELDRTRTPDSLRDWKQLTHYAKLLSQEIFCLFLKNGASQYLFLFDILTKRTEPFRNLSYKPSTRLPFVLDGTLLLSNYGYAVSFVNLLLLGKKRLSSHRRDQGRRACVLLHCVHHFYSLIPQARTTWTMLFLLIVKTKTVFLRSPNPSQEKKPDTSATFDPLPIPYRFVGPVG